MVEVAGETATATVAATKHVAHPALARARITGRASIDPRLARELAALGAAGVGRVRTG
jgi:hypothetical protein